MLILIIKLFSIRSVVQNTIQSLSHLRVTVHLQMVHPLDFVISGVRSFALIHFRATIWNESVALKLYRGSGQVISYND